MDVKGYFSRITLLLSSRTLRKLYTIGDDQVVESEQVRIVCLWMGGREERRKKGKGKEDQR